MRSRSLFQIAAAALSTAGLAAFAAPDARAQQVFFDDFDGGLTGGTWTTQNNATSDPGADFSGNAFYFDGNGGAGTGDRFAATSNLNLSAGSIQVTFLLRYEGTSGVAMEMDVDGMNYEHFEDTTDSILLEYSTDGGSNWTTVTTFADTSDTYQNTGFARVDLPSGAWQSSVQIRVWQDGTNVANGKDQWAIDDFTVLVTPEPGTWALFGLGTAAMGAWVGRRRAARRRRSAAANSSPPDASAPSG